MGKYIQILKDVFLFIKKYFVFILLGILVACGAIISCQKSKIDKLNDEVTRQKNNILAITDTLTVYKDDLGRSNAEKHAYQLTQKELLDSISDLKKKKNREYVSYVNTDILIRDTVKVPTTIIREVTKTETQHMDDGTIYFAKSDTFGQSSRSFDVSIPYYVDSKKLFTKDASFNLNQNIFVEAWLERNKKTNETYVHLRSDYPNLIFNSGLGIVAKQSSSFDRSMRKNTGIGIAVGPNVGISYDLKNHKYSPTIGLGVTIGLTYTPKFLQW